jgi:hypothetical protein
MLSRAAENHSTDIDEAQPGRTKARAKMGYSLSSIELFE